MKKMFYIEKFVNYFYKASLLLVIYIYKTSMLLVNYGYKTSMLLVKYFYETSMLIVNFFLQTLYVDCKLIFINPLSYLLIICYKASMLLAKKFHKTSKMLYKKKCLARCGRSILCLKDYRKLRS